MRGQNDNFAAMIFISLIVIGIVLIGLSVMGFFEDKQIQTIDPIEEESNQATILPTSTPKPTITISTVNGDDLPPLPPG